MWTTIPGNGALTRRTDRDSEALAAYVRAEYGETDVDWFLAEVRRAAKKAKGKRSPNGDRRIIAPESVPG